MEFNHFLSSYYPDTSYGADRHYADMLEQAIAAERFGYASVSIPEHHLMNILMNPAPLQMAIKVASETRRIKIITSVVQLPLHDMRTYAGEVVLAELFTDGRLILGVGRGAFSIEMDWMGTPIETSREKFDESLNVLQALLESPGMKAVLGGEGKAKSLDSVAHLDGNAAGRKLLAPLGLAAGQGRQRSQVRAVRGESAAR